MCTYIPASTCKYTCANGIRMFACMCALTLKSTTLAWPTHIHTLQSPSLAVSIPLRPPFSPAYLRSNIGARILKEHAQTPARIYIYIYMYTHTYICMYICMHTHIYLSIYLSIYIYMYINIQLYIYIHMWSHPPMIHLGVSIYVY